MITVLPKLEPQNCQLLSKGHGCTLFCILLSCLPRQKLAGISLNRHHSNLLSILADSYFEASVIGSYTPESIRTKLLLKINDLIKAWDFCRKSADRIFHIYQWVRRMAHPGGVSSNTLFDILAQWNQVLSAIQNPANAPERDICRVAR